MSLLQPLRTLVAKDLEAVDHTILARLQSTSELVQQVSEYIIQSGGKRLRPLLMLLCSRALHYEGNAHIELAVILEFIHTATLLHDDVIDASSLRRGRNTVNYVFGNPASILVGDFLYSRAFQMMTHLKQPEIYKILADTTNTIAEGEVLQLQHRHNPTLSEATYSQVILQKTAILFAAAAQLAAVITNSNFEIQETMQQYGLHLGIAFQLVDDMLDYQGDVAIIGKNIGDDLAEGKMTLPLIYAASHASKTQKKMIVDAICHGKTTALAEIITTIKSTGALEYTEQVAINHIKKAQAALIKIPTSPYQQALLDLVTFVVHRDN